ncbi:MAG: transglutaminase family protein [Pirellulaceae bacterium]
MNHQTIYRYDRSINLGPQVIRLRPAPHSRTPIDSYSLKVSPADHYLNWQQDPFGNYLARCVFNDKLREFTVEVDVVATMTVINPFDFFLEPHATDYPFAYDAGSVEELRPYFHRDAAGPKMHAFLATLNYEPRRTIDFLVDLNVAVQNHIAYTLRMEPGVQTPEQTLTLKSGSCRDSGWLMVQLLRQLGFAARFVSGYLIQLTADQKSLDGPSGPENDFTDLHAWCEVYLPGAGWIGLDPTSGLFAGEGHIPLACTPQPTSAAPITGTLDECEVQFEHHMSVTRIHEDPRVTLPYTDEQWSRIESLGHVIDEHLHRGDVRLTMGGEPTFVSIDDMDGEEWQTAAVGPTKRKLAYDLLLRLKSRFSTGGVLHFGQGKWYPGEPLPRWAMAIFWRKDGQPIWRNDQWLADVDTDYGHTADDARQFAKALAKRLGVKPKHAIFAYEDAMYYMWRERRLPPNVDVRDSKLESQEERQRIARIFEQGLTKPVGVALPLRHVWWTETPHWASGPWKVRSEEMFLLPGDSPMGYRLPLQSLIYEQKPEHALDFFDRDPLEPVGHLLTSEQIRQNHLRQLAAEAISHGNFRVELGQPLEPVRQFATVDGLPAEQFFGKSTYPGNYDHGDNGFNPSSEDDHSGPNSFTVDTQVDDESSVVPTALCVEPREGRLHVFLPPTDRLESFLELISAIEATAEAMQTPVVIEGYQPPHDVRLQHMRVTPDPGVIEVNVHPANDWNELVDITNGVYEDARTTRLGTEKFDLDGQHTGTGGGNHVVLGGLKPADSPFLRRPDLLKSLITYWNNHPSLSYLFSGKFIGPTSQAPRVDESRTDAIYELKIACQQVRRGETTPPWLVDRIFRHLLVDVTGNTHRAEFCIDKLYSPDSATGRLGLVEFRGFEMPPHARMSLTQQLLIRGLVARFWEQPYDVEMVDWGTSLHDRFMLPHFVWEDFSDIVDDLRDCGFAFEREWFGSHHEFRFPIIGEFAQRSIHVELRKAIEPWYVLGEEATGGGTARYVDSSVERLQVKVSGMTNSRHVLTCNGRRLPLHPTGVEGQFVAGVRYRAWQPPSCLHPTIPVDSPLVFDLIDSWNHRAIGGCQYHVSAPTGLNSPTFPVNAFEAESRRAARFFRIGHTGGRTVVPQRECNAEFPMTLDLRNGRVADANA